jgi:hypothetical protein
MSLGVTNSIFVFAKIKSRRKGKLQIQIHLVSMTLLPVVVLKKLVMVTIQRMIMRKVNLNVC